MDPDAVPPDVLRSSVVQRRYDAYNRLQGVSRCLNARPGAPRDSAPAAVYVVFGPALNLGTLNLPDVLGPHHARAELTYGAV